MELSEGEQFLVTACRVAQTHDYFHWRVVGAKLSWPERRALRALMELNELRQVITLRGEEARLLPAGRELAEKLMRRITIDRPRRAPSHKRRRESAAWRANSASTA